MLENVLPKISGLVLGLGLLAIGSTADVSRLKTHDVAEIQTTQVAAATTYTQPALARRSQVALSWAPEYMSSQHSFTRSQALQIASQFDVVAAMPVAFATHAAAMRAANPNLTLVTYANAMFANLSAASGLPESAFAHSRSGARIKSVAFGLTLMEPSSPQWQSRSASLCQASATRGGYDGCLLDMLTMGIYSKNYVTALPAKPGAGRDYTQSEWRSALITVGESFPRQLPGQVIVGNAVGNAYRYWRAQVTSQPIAGALPGAQMEDFLRGAADPVGNFPGTSQWLDNVNTIKTLESTGRTGFYTTKLWSSASAAQVKQWQAYAMASFLTQANGNSYLAFTPARTSAGATGALNPYKMPTTLGIPTSAMTLDRQLYKRTFGNGLVLVNPGSNSVTLPLTTPARDLDGVVRSQVSLGPHTGTVLVRTVGSVRLDLG